ncbi:hypothetical protein ANO11243_040250 [Dothideomycetidae sp. 11243]|nr:hypothetical protein ANO11243_040250 [fungal sp. No.11243]
MSAVGPELPPHLLAKRKRQLEEEEKDESTIAPGAKRPRSPPLREAPRRQVGPAPPPAPLDERPSHPPKDETDSEDSDDDDGFGPSLPTADRQNDNDSRSFFKDEGSAPSSSKATGSTSSVSKRDDWMTMPPTQDDLASRLDPSRPRPRGFNTGKASQGPSGAGGDNSIWTETPEQKRKRLQDQVMGVTPEASSASASITESRTQAQRDEDRKRAAKLKASRGESLYTMHQGKEGVPKDDDPSQRAFDREKDMGGGSISGKQRNELLNRAAGFSSKFSGGNFL